MEDQDVLTILSLVILIKRILIKKNGVHFHKATISLPFLYRKHSFKRTPNYALQLISAFQAFSLKALVIAAIILL